MKFNQFLIAGITIMLLTSCGGGSSGGASDTTADTTATTSSTTTTTSSTDTSGTVSSTSDVVVDQVFSGTATVVAMSDSFGTLSGSDAITIIINGVTVTISYRRSAVSGTLDPGGASFSVPVTAAISESGISCAGTVIFNGSISGNTITGTISGTVPCNGLGLTVSVALSGSFSATM